MRQREENPKRLQRHFTPIIPATLEVEIRRITVPS
jgi:hypothetical protein